MYIRGQTHIDKADQILKMRRSLEFLQVKFNEAVFRTLRDVHDRIPHGHPPSR
jgi:hypothetical protein